MFKSTLAATPSEIPIIAAYYYLIAPDIILFWDKSHPEIIDFPVHDRKVRSNRLVLLRIGNEGSQEGCPGFLLELFFVMECGSRKTDPGSRLAPTAVPGSTTLTETVPSSGVESRDLPCMI